MVLTVGVTENALPVPILVPAVATVYQIIVPVAQVAFNIIGFPEHTVGLLALTAVGTAGIAVTVTAGEATLGLSHALVLFLQSA